MSIFKESFLYFLLLTTLHYLGKYFNPYVFRYGFLAIGILLIGFWIIVSPKLKQNSSSYFTKLLLCLSIGSIALCLFLIINLILSFKLNTDLVFDLNAPLQELPDIFASIFIYGIWTFLFSIFITLFYLKEKPVDYNVLDDEM